jgi:hypothetical protein
MTLVVSQRVSGGLSMSQAKLDAPEDIITMKPDTDPLDLITAMKPGDTGVITMLKPTKSPCIREPELPIRMLKPNPRDGRGP